MFFGSRKLQSDALQRCREKWLHRYSLGKLKDVKDKLFHLDPVGFVGTDELTLGVHVGDLLLGHVVLQLWLILAVKRGETTSADGRTSSFGCGSTVGGSQVKSARVRLTVQHLWGRRSWRSGWPRSLRWTWAGRRGSASGPWPAWSRCTPPPGSSRPPCRPRPQPPLGWFSPPPARQEHHPLPLTCR